MKISRHVVSGFLLFGLICLYVACESVSEPVLSTPTVRANPPTVSEAPAPVVPLEPAPPVISEAPAPEPPVVVLVEEVAVPKENVVFDSGDSLEDAVQRSYEALLEILPPTVSIAIVKIDSDDKDEAKLVVEKLSFLLFDSTLYSLVERRNLDSVLREQRFQALSEMDDKSARIVGQRTGAEISIVGAIREEEAVRYLRLRVLNVETSKLLVATSEQFVSRQPLLTRASGAERAMTTVSD